MNFELLIPSLVIYMVVLLLAISAHEAAHAWMSYRFGDDTARLLGRISLSPVTHTHPIGTLLIPVMMFILSYTHNPLAAVPLIGWGQPTPVNPLRWRNKDVANIMVSIAGILANLTLATIAFVILKVLFMTNADYRMSASTQEPIFLFLFQMLVMNISLAVFNLLPFPPLDGSRVLDSILPASARPMLDFLEQYGFILLLIAMYAGVLDIVIQPVLQFVVYLLRLGL